MQRLLFLLCFLVATNAHAAPVRLRFDAVVVSSPAALATVGAPVTGSFWFDTEGRVVLNSLLGIHGRQFGYTYVAPAQSAGIRFETGTTVLETGRELRTELRNYGLARTDRVDEFEISWTSVFEEVSILFRGGDAAFFEGSGFSVPTVPRFPAETPFLEYSQVQVRVHNPRRYGPVDFVASLLPESIVPFLLGDLPAPDDSDPGVGNPLTPTPEPTTGMLLLLGTLGLAVGARRR